MPGKRPGRDTQRSSLRESGGALLGATKVVSVEPEILETESPVDRPRDESLQKPLKGSPTGHHRVYTQPSSRESAVGAVAFWGRLPLPSQRLRRAWGPRLNL